MGVFDGQNAATTLPKLQGPDIDFTIELDPAKCDNIALFRLSDTSRYF
jgi:hypothetical protein